MRVPPPVTFRHPPEVFGDHESSSPRRGVAAALVAKSLESYTCSGALDWPRHNAARARMRAVLERVCRKYPREFPFMDYCTESPEARERRIRLVGDLGGEPCAWFNDLSPEAFERAVARVAEHFGVEE